MSRFLSDHKATIILVCGVAALLGAGWMLPLTIAELWEWGARVSGHPLAILGIVLLMGLLTTFGLPGSLCFWMIAPFHAPWLSVCMLLAGSVGGALGAYRVGMGLGGTWSAGETSEKLLSLLEKRSDLLTQCALRIMPGVPHALVNLAAGVLRLRLIRFASAAILGLSIKWSVYSHTVHGMVSATLAEEALEISAILPLVVLGVLLILGSLAKGYWFGKQRDKGSGKGPHKRNG